MEPSPIQAIVIAGGELHVQPEVTSDDLVVAADSGYDAALTLGIAVDILIGDLDSISPRGREHAAAESVLVVAHPTHKDATDLELAIRAAIEHGATSISIYGGEGGRLGHLLGIASTLANPEWSSVEIAWHTATGTVSAVHSNKPLTLNGPIGATVTLIPLGRATGISTTGFAWELANGTLQLGTSRGVSNQMDSTEATIEVGSGTVLVIEEGIIST
jgi:thiamine pyrophosphokinase